MEPLIFSSLKEYLKAGPLPWLGGHSKKDKAIMLKIIKEGIKSKLNYKKIATNLHNEFPELKVKSEYPHMSYLSSEIVITEMRIYSELETYSSALEHKEKGWIVVKRWSSMPDENVCPICRENSNSDWIPLLETFPSGHMYAPSHQACRCHTQFRYHKNYEESGLPKDRWIVEREGDIVKVKPNPKYAK